MPTRRASNPTATAQGGAIARYGSNVRRNRSLPMTNALNATIRAQARGGTGGTGGSGGTGG